MFLQNVVFISCGLLECVFYAATVRLVPIATKAKWLHYSASTQTLCRHKV